jgi:hypothetical protein
MIEGFCHQPVSHPVTATGTVVHDGIVKGSGFRKYFIHPKPLIFRTQYAGRRTQ